ncbi:MAG: hypothetical protein Q4C00_03115 [Bacillota bacterium]|nr:hypothetical protein [Bacillota bacterium]
MIKGISKIFICGVFFLISVASFGCDSSDTTLNTDESGQLLAYIDGTAYYYDPVYLFDFAYAAMPQEPDREDKATALNWELSCLESQAAGEKVPSTWVESQIYERKYEAEHWPESIEEQRASVENNDTPENREQLEYLEEYYQRYTELWDQRLQEYGDEDKYYEAIKPAIEKYYYCFKYTSALIEEYLELVRSGAAPVEDRESYILKDFPELVEKYKVELVDEELKSLI